jgi:hypothetical protein
MKVSAGPQWVGAARRRAVGPARTEHGVPLTPRSVLVRTFFRTEAQ